MEGDAKGLKPCLVLTVGMLRLVNYAAVAAAACAVAFAATAPVALALSASPYGVHSMLQLRHRRTSAP